MKLNVAAKTDSGLLHDHNEDYYVIRRSDGLFLVADGVGGAVAGDLASKVGCQLIEQALHRADRSDPRRHDVLLVEAIRHANHGLYEFGCQHRTRRDLGSTITALWFHGDRVLFAYVGDSRIYLFRKGVLRQLSRDEKAGRYRLAASLGVEDHVEPHLGMVRLRRGDRFLLCTDGLHGPVSRADLTTILDGEPEPEACCERLVAKANDAGGPDNITCLVADVVEAGPPQRWRFSRVWADATSPVARVLRVPRWLAIATAVALAAACVWWAATQRGGDGAAKPPRVTGRLAVLASEANQQAEAGDPAAARRALEALIRQAVQERTVLERADLALAPGAAKLFDEAARAVWDKLCAPAGGKLDALAAAAAGRFVEDEIRATRERLEHVRQQFLADDFRFVAETFEWLEHEVETIADRGNGDLAAAKERLAEAVHELRFDASELEPDNPLRRTLEAHAAAAAQALEADDIDRAQDELDAARAAVKRDAPDGG